MSKFESDTQDILKRIAIAAEKIADALQQPDIKIWIDENGLSYSATPKRGCQRKT